MGRWSRFWVVAAAAALLLWQTARAHNTPIDKPLQFQNRPANEILSSSSAHPDRVDTPGIAYVTKGGYIAATNESLLNRAIVLALSRDKAAFARFIKSDPNVFPLKKGLEVFLEKTVWPGKILIRPKTLDISIWTVREAIE